MGTLYWREIAARKIEFGSRLRSPPKLITNSITPPGTWPRPRGPRLYPPHGGARTNILSDPKRAVGHPGRAGKCLSKQKQLATRMLTFYPSLEGCLRHSECFKLINYIFKTAVFFVKNYMFNL